MKVKKLCFVPLCRNNSETTPNKLFISVPRDEARRKRWYAAIAEHYVPKGSHVYCCEDHFNLDVDAENWIEYKTIGTRLRIKENVVPHRFIHSPAPELEQTSQLTSEDKKRKLAALQPLGEKFVKKFFQEHGSTVQLPSMQPSPEVNIIVSSSSGTFDESESLSQQIYFYKVDQADTIEIEIEEKGLLKVVDSVNNFFSLTPSECLQQTSVSEAEDVDKKKIEIKEEALCKVEDSDNFSSLTPSECLPQQISFSEAEQVDKQEIDIEEEIRLKVEDNDNFSSSMPSECLQQISVSEAEQMDKTGIEIEEEGLLKVEDNDNFLPSMLSESLQQISVSEAEDVDKKKIEIKKEALCKVEDCDNFSSLTPSECLPQQISFSEAEQVDKQEINIEEEDRLKVEDNDNFSPSLPSECLQQISASEAEQMDKQEIDIEEEDRLKTEDNDNFPPSMPSECLQHRSVSEAEQMDKTGIEIEEEGLLKVEDSDNFSSLTPSEWSINGSTSGSTAIWDSETADRQLYCKVHIKLIENNSMLYLGLPKRSYFLVKMLAESFHIEYQHVLIILKKIRLDNCNAILADDFGVSESLVENIFNEHVPALAAYLKKMIFWPSPEHIEEMLPIPFRQQYQRVQSILNCHEMEIEIPTDPMKQALTWSSDRHCNTVKYLISTTPHGVINYISTGFGGRTTDKTMVEKCGYLDVLPPNCQIMVDRGFKQISQVVASKNCHIIRAPSVLSTAKPTGEEVHETRRIAELRTHVESTIRRLREFRMLRTHGCISNSYLHLYDSTVISIKSRAVLSS